MKKDRIDKQQDISLKLLRPLVYIWMWLDARRKVHKTDLIDFKTKEPFILLANHTFMFDVVHVPLRIKNVPFIIASQTLFTKQPSKFLVSKVAHVIPKSKGKSDFKSIKKIFEVISKGYPVLIFPEGDTTFYGETNYIEESTMKLIKKIGLDVWTCNVKGGYLSKPRWATGKRRRRRIELFYDITIKKEDLKNLEVDEINKIINDALYNDAYEYQREKMHPHPGKKLAEGLENIVYVCPECNAINTIRTSGNDIKCTNCNTTGYIDKYGFIHGFKFDNLIEWNNYQRKHAENLRNTMIESEGLLSFMEIQSEKQTPVGRIKIVYDKGEFHITGAKEIVIPINEIINPTVTLRRDFGFIYKNQHYMIKLDHYSAAFLRIVQDKY